MEETLSITLKLGSRILPMTVRREDEILYREAEKLINQRFSYYATKYPQQGNEMYLTMMALDVALQLKTAERDADPQPVLQRLGSLVTEVEEVLQQK